MIHEYNVRVLPQQAHNEEAIANYIARDKGINRKNIKKVRVLKRSIDARQRTIFVNLSLRVYVNELPSDEEFEYTQYNDVSHKPAVIVVGEGPAGLFASLRLIEKGFRPIVLEA